MVPKELAKEQEQRNVKNYLTLSLREFLASIQITVLEHPPYSPDLAPTDSFLFSKI
jgi:hypothetical protein